MVSLTRQFLANACRSDALAFVARRVSGCRGLSDVVSLTSTRVRPSVNIDSEKATVVLIHGLDNWRGTWRATADALAKCGVQSLAVDLRGHGESQLGSVESFSAKNLALDLRAVVQSEGLMRKDDPTVANPLILVGHSMGGRVALRYAAEFPDDVAAVVVEDMECVARTWMLPQGECPSDLRNFADLGECREVLQRSGYSALDISQWLVEIPPRIFEIDGRIWSAVNPAARHLSIVHVLASLDALDALDTIAASNVPLHVMVAGNGVCSWDATPGGLNHMLAICPRMVVHRFDKSGHSIHGTQLESFVDCLVRIENWW